MFDDSKLFIFDLDGTLIKFHHDYLFTQAERIITELMHAPVERTILENHFSDFDFFKFVVEAEREQFMGKFWSAFDWNNFPRPELIPGTLQTLQAIKKRGLKIGIATARFVELEALRNELHPTGLLDHVEFIIPRPGDHIHWTDKTGQLLDACKHFNVSPEEAVMVGDIPPDVTSAQQVGFGRTVAVLSGGIRREILETANASIVLQDVSLIRL